MSFLEHHPCPNSTVPDRLKFWGETSPDTPAFIFWGSSGRRVLSRADVFCMSSRFAFRLGELGVNPGDVVAIILPNSPERVIADFGIILAGAVSMNGQLLRADGEDLFGSLSRAQCKAVVMNPEEKAWKLFEENSEKCDVFDTYAEISSKRIQSLERIVFCKGSNRESLFELPMYGNTYFALNKRSTDDVCVIFATSGSTGYSKLVPCTHRQLLLLGYNVGHALNLENGMKHFSVSPLGWNGGYPSCFLISGCTMVLVDSFTGGVQNKWSFAWETICKEKADTALLVPLAAEALFQVRNESNDHHKLTTTVLGGQPITKVCLKYLGTLADKLCLMHGTTEYGVTTYVHIDEGNIDSFADLMCGFPVPCNKLKVVDEHNNEVPANTRGELVVQSLMLTTGYIGDKDATEKSFQPGGWFKSNDIGYIREDGCLFVEGRGSEAIMHGAYILYPAWLEKYLLGCPGARNIVIVPVPDKILHHEICACVKRDDSDMAITKEDVINYARQQMILEETSSLSVIPKYVVFIIEFPQSATGKTDRKRLSKMAAEILHLKE